MRDSVNLLERKLGVELLLGFSTFRDDFAQGTGVLPVERTFQRGG